MKTKSYKTIGFYVVSYNYLYKSNCFCSENCYIYIATCNVTFSFIISICIIKSSINFVVFDLKFILPIYLSPLHNYPSYLYQTFFPASPKHACRYSHIDSEQGCLEHQNHNHGSCSL